MKVLKDAFVYIQVARYSYMIIATTTTTTTNTTTTNMNKVVRLSISL